MESRVFDDVVEVEITHGTITSTFMVAVEFSENRPLTTSDGVHIGGERKIEDVMVFEYVGVHIPGKYSKRQYQPMVSWLRELLLETIDIDKLNSDWS